MASFATHNRVDLTIATETMGSCATQDRVDFIIAADVWPVV